MTAQLDVAAFELIPGKGHFGWLEQEDQVLGRCSRKRPPADIA